MALREVYEVHGDKFRFLVVGVWNTIFSIVLYNIGIWLTKPTALSLQQSSNPTVAWLAAHYYIVMFWLVWVVAVVQSTATMKYFVFRSPGAFWPQVRKAYVVYLPAQAISTGILWAVVQLLHAPPSLGQLLAIGVSTIFSYVGHRYFTFRSVPEAEVQGDPQP